MSTTSIIILVLMLLAVVVSFLVLFVIKVPSYNPTINKITNEKYENDGTRLTQKELLANTDYVLNAF